MSATHACIHITHTHTYTCTTHAILTYMSAKCLYRGTPLAAAPALAAAMETARMAFAPMFVLLGVPSTSISCVCVCVCVFVRERERERERERVCGREGGCVCVCLRVCERDRERERERKRTSDRENVFVVS